MLAAILLVSILLRVAVALYLGDTTPPAKDETSYSTLAARLATGYGYTFPAAWYPFTPPDTPTAHWSFLYTAFVAAVYGVAGAHPLAARLVQAILVGALLPWLTYRLTRRLQNSPQPPAGQWRTLPLLAAALSALYAYFILYGAMLQTEAFYICALLWSLERALYLQQTLDERAPQRSRLAASFTLGLSLGIAALLRQSVLPWVAVLFVYLFLTTRPVRRALPALVAAALVLLACILPFTIRNFIVYDEQFLLLNSNAGYAMYSAQHPLHGTSFQEYAAAPLPEDLLDKGLNEAGWDRALSQRGLEFVLADPGRYLLLSLSRVRDYFEFWPTADSSLLFNLGRLASFTLLLPFMLAGLALALIGRAPGFSVRASAFMLLFMAVYALLHVLTWAMSRYRLPVDAAALPFAALAIREVHARLSSRAGLRAGSSPGH